MKKGMIAFFFLLGLQAQARISVMFHPYENTFQAISKEIEKAKSSIDIAMYNMDAYLSNPVIAKIASAEMQKKIRSHQLQIRMLFQGYGGEKKLKFFESLGMDVRFIEGKKMHHKFAVIDIQDQEPKVISGSANWSLFSRMNYSENILFFDHEPMVATAFHRQFEFLWALGKDYGSRSRSHALKEKDPEISSPGIQVFFNSVNFKVEDGRLVNDKESDGYALTRQVVKAIDQAQKSVQVASTRIRLRPIYEALVRASRRGVKVQIVVSMDEYETLFRRQKKELEICPDLFEKDCSVGSNFSVFLTRKAWEENKNVDLRVKFFNINLRDSLAKQMHSKYVIIDGSLLLTGSFNWSYSSEYSHIENLVSIQGKEYPRVLARYEDNFRNLFRLRRAGYADLIHFFEKNFDDFNKVDCSFEPMSLTFKEIDYLLDTDHRKGGSFKSLCVKKDDFSLFGNMSGFFPQTSTSTFF